MSGTARDTSPWRNTWGPVAPAPRSACPASRGASSIISEKIFASVPPYGSAIARTAAKSLSPNAARNRIAHRSSWIDRMNAMRARVQPCTTGATVRRSHIVTGERPPTGSPAHQDAEARNPSTNPSTRARLIAAAANTTVTPAASTAFQSSGGAPAGTNSAS